MAQFRLHKGDEGVEGTEIARSGVSGIEGDAIGIGKGHEDGRDTKRVEFTEQEVAVEVDKRKYVFQHFTNIFFHDDEILNYGLYGLYGFFMTEAEPKAEGQGGDDESHEDYGEHAHDGDLSKGVKGWMTGNDEGTDANEHDECREHDRPAIGGKHGTMVLVLIDRTLCHEDGIVVALTKDEGAQDNVDDIELNAQQRHDTQYPQPTDSHGQER